MSILNPGVKVFLGERGMYWDRVQLSAGTVTAPSTVSGLAYEDGARVPTPEWRAPTAAERTLLVATTLPKDLGKSVGIVMIPNHLFRPFGILESAASTLLERNQILPFLNDTDCLAGIEAIKSFLRRCFHTPSSREAIQLEGGIVVKAPQLATVTMNPHNGKLVGLHLDDCYRFPLDRRHQSPNRICINIGPQDRFFLFLNLPIGQISKALRGTGSKISYEALGGTAVARLFMTRFPSYPVVRVRIKPGDAYIAPTENIIHDGSSSETRTFDVSLSLRGRFTLLREET